MVYTEFTLWLTPGEPLRSKLRSIISQVAKSLDAIEFEPHVTVFCSPSTDAEACALVDQIAKQFGSIELVADRLDYTDHYTKTLFVQFKESTVLRQIFEIAVGCTQRQSNYCLNPHLSLLYKKLPNASQRALCETLDVPMGNFWFDGIRIIETELPIEDAGPITRWRVVREAKLEGPQH